jgi:hypothetical protein
MFEAVALQIVLGILALLLIDPVGMLRFVASPYSLSGVAQLF